MSEMGRSMLQTRSEPKTQADHNEGKKSSSGSHMALIRNIIGGLPAAEAEKILAAVSGMRDYYQYHIRRLKDLVRDRVADTEALQVANNNLRMEAANSRQAERDQATLVEELRLQAIDRDKEMGRLRVFLEEEKAKVFQKRRAEQDWLDDCDKLKREIAALRELGNIKEEEITYLKKQLRSVEDEAIDLRDHKRELMVKMERLQAQPMVDEKNQIEKSSKYLVEQINSLKRELYKAKTVVENYKIDRESEHQESLNRQARRRNSQPDFTDQDRQRSHSPDYTPADREERLNQSWNDDKRNSRFSTPNYRDEGQQSRRHDRTHAEVPERGSSFDHPHQAVSQRQGRIERRHQPKLSNDFADPRNDPRVSIATSKDPFAEHSINQELSIRRDPNRGHGNIIATDYPEAQKKGQHKDTDFNGRLTSAQKSRLQADIGSFYCRVF
jgi:hypothetical protein